MSIKDLVKDVKVNIDSIILYCEKNSDNSMLNQSYALKDSYKNLLYEIREILVHKDFGEIKEIQDNLKVVLDVAKSEKVTTEKKITLMQAGINRCIKNKTEKKSTDNVENLGGKTSLRKYLSKIASKQVTPVGMINYKKDISDIKYDAQIDKYFINNVLANIRNKKFFTKTKKAKYLLNLIGYEDFEYIFSGQQSALRKCDPSVVQILNEKNKELARRYVQDLEHGIKYKNTGYSITYDSRARGRKSNLGLFEKLKAKLNIFNNKEIAVVKKDERRISKLASIPVVGVLALVGMGGINVNSNITEKQENENSYSDSVNPTDNNNSNIKTEEGKEDNLYDRIAKFSNQDNIYTEDEKSSIVLEEQEPEVVVNIGDKVLIEEGTKYTANCAGGGTTNTIGSVSWRPECEYSIDNIAYYHGDKFLGLSSRGQESINEEISRFAKECGVSENEISTVALISLVPGAADTGWAKIDLNKLQKNKVITQESETTDIEVTDINYER